MQKYIEIIERAVNAPLPDMSGYEPVAPSGKPRFIQNLCFELLDEIYRSGTNIPSAAIFRAETYASGAADYTTTFASILAKITGDLSRNG